MYQLLCYEVEYRPSEPEPNSYVINSNDLISGFGRPTLQQTETEEIKVIDLQAAFQIQFVSQ